jgi:Rrf2 family nitric oxide-sensitive transcriptional repressor
MTLYTDYSLRVLIYLGLRRGERCTIQEIAGQYGISRNHLMKVCQDLQQRGYVHSVRGKNGGISLGRAPQEINVGRVFREMEPDLQLVECFGEDDQCVIARGCRLQGVLNEALQAFVAVLDRYSLADVLVNPQRLSQLLDIPIVVQPATATA